MNQYLTHRHKDIQYALLFPGHGASESLTSASADSTALVFVSRELVCEVSKLPPSGPAVGEIVVFPLYAVFGHVGAKAALFVSKFKY